MTNKIKFAFFGGEPLAVPVLEGLKSDNLLPSLIVCNPDRPSGRGKKLTAPPAKVWAQENNIEVFQPHTLKNKEELTIFTDQEWDLFVVVAYNKILPEWFINIPKKQTINLHPSLLPKLRGASPIRTAILEDNREAIGTSVMLLDKEMDHGPLLAQLAMSISDDNWPVDGQELDQALAHMGGALLSDTMVNYVAGNIEPIEQNHDEATYCGRLEKSMGELQINPHNPPTGTEAHSALLKIKAFSGFPGTFFFHEGKRYKITEATVENDTLKILRIVPEGKKETDFSNLY